MEPIGGHVYTIDCTQLFIFDYLNVVLLIAITQRGTVALTLCDWDFMCVVVKRTDFEVRRS